MKVPQAVDQKQELLYKIEKTRQHMIETAKQKGFLNKETILCSQKLDNLLILYQKMFK